MRAHAKPETVFDINIQSERDKLDAHRVHRAIPDKTDDHLLIATWNLTNYGLQKRLQKHIRLMAHIASYFDIIAVQEIADDLTQFDELMEDLGPNYKAILTDVAGNNERLGYIYDSTKVTPTGLIAELAMRGYQRQTITIVVGEAEETETFDGFNRNPYMVSFVKNDFTFTLVNVHLYWTHFSIRQLETKALAKWAKSRINKSGPPNNDIILIGDFNMPSLKDTDKIYKELKAAGLRIPKYDTEIIGSNLAGDKHYDEVAFFPSRTDHDFTGQLGVFDYDKIIFEGLWSDSDADAQKEFFRYIRYYMTDHRPFWCQFKTN